MVLERPRCRYQENGGDPYAWAWKSGPQQTVREAEEGDGRRDLAGAAKGGGATSAQDGQQLGGIGHEP